MNRVEFGHFLERLAAAWRNTSLDDAEIAHYWNELHTLDLGTVMAALASLSREDRPFAPTAGQMIHRVVELEIDPPPWSVVHKTLADMIGRGGTKAPAWKCPYEKCDGTTYTLNEDGDAVPCECHDERVESARKRGERVHPLIREFYEHITPENLRVTWTEGGSGEARLREKWREFVKDKVEVRVLDGIEGPAKLRKLARANEEPKALGDAIKGALPAPPGEAA